MNENECETQGKQTGLMFGNEYKSSLASRTRTLIFTGMRGGGMRISRTVSQTSPFSSSRSRPANICSWFGDSPVVHKDCVITCLALTRTPEQKGFHRVVRIRSSITSQGFSFKLLRPRELVELLGIPQSIMSLILVIVSSNTQICYCLYLCNLML